MWESASDTATEHRLRLEKHEVELNNIATVTQQQIDSALEL